MSLELIAAGTILCLLGLFAFLPPFDGNWDPSALPRKPQPNRLKIADKEDPAQRARDGYSPDKG
jgi:hypothetical protein